MVKVFQPIRRAVEHPRRAAGQAVKLARGAGGDPPEIPGDVWHWTSPKYRVRAVVLLLVNALLFVGLGCFTFWLRTGAYSPFVAQYWDLWWEAFDPVREHQVTLIDFLIHPIPVEQVPLMMVIVGLVLASLTAVPILVSMLYRFPFSLIFTAIIGFVAVLPWLAVTVTLCCWLARWKPLRFSFRYATALIALLPVLAYYALATGSPSGSAHLTPVDVAKLYVPWGLAIVGACLLMAIVLLIAKLVNYRPGAIAPLMAVMFAVPVVLFETKVGRDELYYRLLQVNYGPGSKVNFVEERSPADLIRKITEDRLEIPRSEAVSPESVAEQVQASLQLRLARGLFLQDEFSAAINEQFATERHEAIREARRFRARFPHSRYAANALYLEGLATDMRVDPVLTGTRGALVVRHYTDFPNAASQPVWLALHEGFPDSPLAATATLRLATLEARAGNVDRAIALLDELATRGSSQTQRTEADTGGWRDLLARRPAASTLEVDIEAVLLEARKLRELLAENRDPQQRDLPLARLLSMDPRHPQYRRNLERFSRDIPQLYPMTRIGDNVHVLLARAQPSVSERIRQLREVVRELGAATGSDALVRAKFELGAAYQADNLPDAARQTYEDIRRNHADSPWAAEANRRLATLNITGRVAPSPGGRGSAAETQAERT